MSKKHNKKKKNKKILNGIDLINQTNTINNNDESRKDDKNQENIVDNYKKEINNDLNSKDNDTNIYNIPDNSNLDDIKQSELKSEFEKQEEKINKNITEISNSIEKENHDLLEIKKEKVNPNINEKIQSFISILFTIIIFLALILLIITLYKNNFSNNNSCDKEKVCQEYIKKDYNINTDEVINFIKLNRGIFYTIENFDNKTDLNTFITYYIWSREGEYLECSDDSNCLVTKKEIDEDELLKVIKTYLNKDLKELSFNSNFNDTDNIRLYKKDGKVILTFKEFIYESLRHEVINIVTNEDNIKVYLALLKNDNGNYDYVGYKEINLKYLNNNYIIESIKTNYAN